MSVRSPIPLTVVVVGDYTPTLALAPALADSSPYPSPSHSYPVCSESEKGRSVVVDPPSLVELPSGVYTPMLRLEWAERRKRGWYDASPSPPPSRCLYLGRSSVLDLGLVGRRNRSVVVVAVEGMGYIPMPVSMPIVFRTIVIEAEAVAGAYSS